MGRKTALVYILVMGLGSLLLATSGHTQEQAPVYTTPLGIALDGYPYPYPVQFLPSISTVSNCGWPTWT